MSADQPQKKSSAAAAADEPAPPKVPDPPAEIPDADCVAWQRVQLARHPLRPNFVDWLPALCSDFSELHGDRRFGDDAAIVGGFARFRGREVMVIGQQKGREIKEKIRRNFGMAQPEGYRKALRLMRLAEKFDRPILTFVDTNGAYPGVDAEERGQAEAIALNLREMAKLRVPIVATITGEGGSGGALAIAIGNRILMMENAVYSVITPEGCASITWRDANMKARAARALMPTAEDMLRLGLVDEVVPEPNGGAHTDLATAAAGLGDALDRHLSQLEALPRERLAPDRYQRFRVMGCFFENA